MKINPASKPCRVALPAVALLLTLVVGTFTAPPAGALEGPDKARLERLKAGMDQAKDDGAKGQLPQTWWDLDERIDAVEKNGATEDQWLGLETEVVRLQCAATFIAQMRKHRSGMEALLGRFDQALAEIGALYGIEPDPVLSGSPAASDLVDRLGRRNLNRQIMLDSLTVENRRLKEIVETRVVYQDSMITALQVEVSSLRQKLWDTELRAGVAEADRSAAESVLTRKQDYERRVAGLREAFGSDEGEILLKPEGEIVLRLFGVSFGVGSAELQPGQEALLHKVVAAASQFPGAALRVEGHTDDTGSRNANLRLSRRRAETVARLLESELGWKAETIETGGFGPDRPIALNSTPEGRAQNRRIDVVIVNRP